MRAGFTLDRWQLAQDVSSILFCCNQELEEGVCDRVSGGQVWLSSFCLDFSKARIHRYVAPCPE